jgi:serine/threonine protein kinase
MPSPWAILRCVGKAVIKAAIKAIPLGDAVAGIASDAYEAWSKESDEQQRRAEIETLAQAPVTEVQVQVADIVAELAHDQPESVRQTVTNYLTLLPSAIHRSLRRAADPSGKTVPPQLALSKGDDLIPFLPPRLPRFKPGDRPLPGVDWELVELLGAGGFGEVWKARNPYLPEPVALKFCLDAATASGLRNEAKLLGRVMQHGKHPGIVQLLRTYLSADPPCLEYEYVGGGDLAGLIRDSRSRGWPIRQAAVVVQEIAKAVGIAHRLDPAIVHRDLKPANILVQRTSDGKLLFQVADFGIGGVVAKQAITEATRAGTTGSLFFATALQGAYTPLYASPQQMRGERPDPRDDVHALGVIWHQLLTGDLKTGVPGGLQWMDELRARGMDDSMIRLLASCFEAQPINRPADAAVLAEGLAKLLTAARVAVVSSRIVVPPKPGPIPAAAGGSRAKAQSAHAHYEAMVKLAAGQQLTAADKADLAKKLTNMQTGLLQTLHAALGGSAAVTGKAGLTAAVRAILTGTSAPPAPPEQIQNEASGTETDAALCGEQEAIERLPSGLQRVYLELKRRVSAFGSDVQTYATRANLIFKAAKNFALITLRSREGALRFLVRPEGFSIPESQSAQVHGLTVTRVPDSHEWALNHEFKVSDSTDLDAVARLLRQSYEAVATATQRR